MTSANVGAVDRILRIILGGVLVAAPFFVGALELPSIPGIAALAVGAMPAFEAFLTLGVGSSVLIDHSPIDTGPACFVAHSGGCQNIKMPAA